MKRKENNFEDNFKEAVDKLEDNIKFVLNQIDSKTKKQIQEIRIRINKPIMIKIFSKNYYLDIFGNISDCETNDSYIVTKDQISQCFQKICEYSLYAHQEQINNGFITLDGGHRVGICGTAVLKNNEIINIKNISSLNIRVAKMIYNVADELIERVMLDGLNGVLICGKPGSGKTTLLKDIIRQISTGKLGQLYNISVIDERGEITGGYNNFEISRDFGDSVDIFDGYLKAEGMMMAVRTMTPDLIVCDEIGTEKETKSIESVLNSGVKVIATIHAGNEEEIYTKPQIKRLISIMAFDKIVLLDSEKNPCTVKKIINIK